MGNDNREHGKDSQSQANKPAQQGKYDPQNKGQPSQGKDAHLDPKSKPMDPLAKKEPDNFGK